MQQPVVIDAQRKWELISFSEIYQFRDLLLLLAARDIKVRYRQAVIGTAWALLQPATALILFAALFSMLGHMPTISQRPYVLSALCGLVPWQFVSNVMLQSSASLVANRQVVTKVYFPRVLVPIAAVLCAALDFAIASILLIGAMLWFGVGLSWSILALPLVLMVLLLAGLGVAMWLSALNALYRDIGFVVPFLVQIGMFVSPVIYETRALIPQQWQTIYAFNPLVGVLEGLRWCLLSTPAPNALMCVASLTAAICLFVSGSLFFSRTNHLIADRI